jgi:hypothetical protein
MEIRIRKQGAWRVIYVARFPAAVHVLHAFERKVRKTRQADIDLGLAPEDATVPAMRARLVIDPRQYIESKNLTQQKGGREAWHCAIARLRSCARQVGNIRPGNAHCAEGCLGRKVHLAPAA